MDDQDDTKPDAVKASLSLGVEGEASSTLLQDNNVCVDEDHKQEKSAIKNPETSKPTLENESKMESEKEGGGSHGRKDTSPVRPCSILLDRTEVSKYLTRDCKKKTEKESPVKKMEKEESSTSNITKNKTSVNKTNITNDEEIIKANTELACKYVCSMCTELYDTVVALRKHALKIHNKRLRSVTVTSSYLKCKICTKNIVSTEINIHMKSLHPEIFTTTTKKVNNKNNMSSQLKLKVFLCTNCSECFSNKTELDKHLKLTHHDDTSNTNVTTKTEICNNCNENFTDLQLHLLECTSNNKRGKRMRKCKNITEVIVSSDSECSADSTDFYCVDCDGEFATKNEYQCHFDTCSVAKKKSKKMKNTKIPTPNNTTNKNSSSDINKNSNKNTINKTIIVDSSNTSSTNKKSLLKRSCTQIKSTNVNDTTNIVDTQQKVTQNNKEILKPDSKTQTQQSQVQFFSCKLCNYFVLTYKDLLEHMYTYHCVLFKCHTCLGNFKSVADYSNHLKKDHSMEKLNLDYNSFKRSPSSMHACKKCDSAFETEKSLDYHMILHKNYEYLYSKLNCIYCDQICNDYETLQEHVNNTHLFCKICDILFVSEEKCKQHKNDHKLGLIKFYVCQYCCNTFKSLEEFNEHCTTYHKIGNLANVSHFTIVKYPQEKLTPILNHLPCPYCESCLEPKYLLQHFKSSHNLEICEKCKYYVIKSNAKICKGCIIKQKEIDENNMKIYASIIQKRKLASEKYQKEKEEEEKRLKNAIDGGCVNRKLPPIRNAGRKGRKQTDISQTSQYQPPATTTMPNSNIPQDPLAINPPSNPLNINYAQASSTVTSDVLKTNPSTYQADNAQSNVIINQTFNFVPIPTNFNQASYVYPTNTSNTQSDLYLGYPTVSNVPQKRDTVIKNLPEYSGMPSVSYYQRNYSGIESTIPNYTTQNPTDTRNWYPLTSTTDSSNTLVNTDKPYYDYNSYTQYQNTTSYLQEKVKSESESYGHCNYNMTQFGTNTSNVKSNTTTDIGIVYDNKNQYENVQYSMLHPSNQGISFPKLSSEVKSESEFSSYVFSDYKLDSEHNLQ